MLAIMLAAGGGTRLRPLTDTVRLAREGKVTHISKHLDPDEVDGEYVGLSLIAPATIACRF